MNVKESFNFKHLFKRASTHVGILVTVSGAIITWYLQQPFEIQQNIPSWVISASSMVSLAGVVGVTLATSYKQKSLKD